jgi:flagellin
VDIGVISNSGSRFELFQNQRGNFSSAGVITMTSGKLSGGEVADLNGDGKLDLFGSLANGGVLYGAGNGSFSVGVSLPNSGASSTDAAAGDVDGDGRFGSLVSGGLQADSVKATGDFNGDGVLDGVSATSGEVYLSDSRSTNTVARLNLETQTDALQSLGIIDSAMSRLSQETGNIGANLSRLETALNVLSARRENYQAAESCITDVDLATETAELVRKQILQQTSTAVLTQANQNPRLTLMLLQNV